MTPRPRLPRPAWALLLALAGCATSGQYLRDAALAPLPDGEVAYRVFLTGNTADLADGGATLAALAADARAAGESSAIVLLGDVTRRGLDPALIDVEAFAPTPEVQRVADLADGYAGELYVVPGDRDWGFGADGVRALGYMLDEATGREDVVLPAEAVGGTREFDVAEGFRLFFLDTAWWLLDADDQPAGEVEGFEIQTPADAATALQSLITDRDDDRILALGHHPVRSGGEHAGAVSLGGAVAGLGVGPLVRGAFGLSRQDLAAPTYRAMRRALDRALGSHKELVYASAHDHSLQTIPVVRSPILRQTYLVSGTGGGATRPVRPGGAAAYAAARPGYQRAVYFADGRLWIESVEVQEGRPVVVHRFEAAGVNRDLLDPEVPADPADLPVVADGATVRMSAQGDFGTGPFSNTGTTRAVFGAGYRDLWATETDFEVLDLGAAGGGLTPIKRGGGLQTTSLRLQGADGYAYTLRLLEKDGLAQVPRELRGGAVGDIVRDQRAAASPYGVLVAARLADAAGVLYQAPRLVYVPDDPRLGRYRELFADRLALFEVRADDDVSAVPGLDGAYDVVSAPKMLEEMREDHDHRVDQRAYFRARLLDGLLGDWDRHQDQWRWAAYEPGELDPALSGDAATQGKVYRPIPRDRDFAFFRPGGILGFFLAYGDSRFEPYGPDFNDTYGQTQNGFSQDRRFFNRLSREDARAVAAELQAALPDIAISRAVAALPPEIRRVEGDFWERSLRARRDALAEYAESLYELHVGTVDVLGSDQRERFVATHNADRSLTVAVYRYKKAETGRELYRRTFRPGETNEVRLYGFAGKDRFDVEGRGPVRVRVIGGGGDDAVESEAANVFVYDTRGGIDIGGRARDRLSDDPLVNLYDPFDYMPSTTRRVPFGGYNATDGVSLGLGFQIMTPGFRLKPAATHFLFGDVAIGTGGVAAGYQGRMKEAVGSFDLDVDALASTPRYVRNFYGFGNGSPPIPSDSATVRIARVQAEALLGGDLGQGLRFVAGPAVRYADAAYDGVFDPDRPPPPPEPGPVGPLSPLDRLYGADGSGADAFRAQLHAGGAARAVVTTVSDPANPRQGLTLRGHGAAYAPVTGAAEAYGRLGGEAIAYVPLRLRPQLTVALRVGADHRLGDYPFFDGAVLGATTGLRGFRRERLTGTTAAYANAEARVKVLDLSTYLLPAELGVLGFYDAGRVFADGDAGGLLDDLQTAYGGGLWLGVLDLAVLNATVARGEETLITVGLGFQY